MANVETCEDNLEVKAEFDELGFVRRYFCPNCDNQLTVNHVDDIGTQWFKCEECGEQTSTASRFIFGTHAFWKCIG